MPYKIKKKGDKYVVYNPDTGKEYGTHDTKKEAEDQVKALYANAPPDEEAVHLRVKIKRQ